MSLVEYLVNSVKVFLSNELRNAFPITIPPKVPIDRYYGCRWNACALQAECPCDIESREFPVNVQVLNGEGVKAVGEFLVDTLNLRKQVGNGLGNNPLLVNAYKIGGNILENAPTCNDGVASVDGGVVCRHYHIHCL